MQYDNDAHDNTPLIHEATASAMKAILPQWIELVQQRGKVAADRLPAVTAKDQARTECSMWISHFFQVLQMWNKRELHDEGIFKFYSTEIQTKPSITLKSDDEVLLWGARILEGEKKRVDSGGVPMQNPTTEAFEPVYLLFRRQLQQVQKKKVDLDQAEEAVNKLRPQGDQLITDAIAEMDYLLRRESAASQRRKMRRYGVRYSFSPGEPPDEEQPLEDAPVQ